MGIFVRKLIGFGWMAVAGVVVLAAPGRDALADVTVTVVDDSGQPVQNGFRWLLELDNSYNAQPGVLSPNADLGAVPGDPSFTLGVNIHHSHAPVVCDGDTAPANNANTFPAASVPLAGPGAATVTIGAANCPGYNPAQRYMVSVLPWHTSPTGTPSTAQTGYTMSGRNVAAGQTAVNVVVHGFPVPTAQITVLVFQDNQPINAAYDQPDETGLPGFFLDLSDPIGKVMQDAFGNPLGTTYMYKYTTADGRPADSTGKLLPAETQPEYMKDPATGLPMVAWLGDGVLKTCPGPTKPLSQYTGYEKANCIDPYTLTPLAAGEAVIRYLNGNKYAVEPIPPRNDPSWILTGTLEGTRQNDAWVRASEPRFNITLGQINWLVFFGFVKPMNHLNTVPNPTHAALGKITGQLVYAHDMHPPLSPGLTPGLPVPDGFVGINNLNGNDEQIYTAPLDPVTGQFSISGVRPGTYQLAFWDKPINAIIDYRTITVGPGQTVAMGPISVYSWFGTFVGSVFQDVNQDGLKQDTEPGIPGIPVALNYTDGSTYGVSVTDSDGNYFFPQYTTWWRYLIAGVDFARFKPTGMTAYIDNGGALPPGPLGAQGINPQLQADGQDHRTETGLVVTEANQLYQDMTNRIDWGKAPWGPGENGGIQGVVNYAITRTEEDPKTSTIDSWEPAVPRVTLQLHQAKKDCTAAGATPENGCWVIADTGAFPLTEVSDSWDDNQPTGCLGTQGTVDQGPLLWENPEIVNGHAIPSCAETFHNWDQVRPGVMDGTYWFKTMPDGSPIPAGDYIVQVVPPTGYQVIQWGDRDIDVGDPKTPFLVQYPECVGATYPVPPYLRWFPDQQNQTDIPGGWDANGNWTNPNAAACDHKHIALNPGANPIVNFHLFTWVPKAARIWGTVWNDVMIEFDPRSPNASGNFGIPWIPVALKDFAGVEVARFYTDQWGHFDGLVPANYDILPPIPLGLTLAMYTVAPNDPGPILDTRPGSPTNGQYITDPWFNPEYSTWVIRENWEFYSGRTTFIDTINLPVGAFVGNRVPVNCDFADKTPEIRQVSDVIIPQTAGGYGITITSVGTVVGPNPAYDATVAGSQPMIPFDHGFGSGGTVTVGGTTLPAAGVTWAADGLSIHATIPNGVSGQLVVTRADNGKASTVGVTLHAQSASVPVVTVSPPPANCQGLACGVIQPAIDAAPPGAIVLLTPGTYQENVNLWKPLTLQGFGAPVTVFDGIAMASNFPLKEKQYQQVIDLSTAGTIGVPPNQTNDFTLEQGGGILVAGCAFGGACPAGNDFSKGHAQIDGITIEGASEDKGGGGILINGYAANLKISNMDLYLNQGAIGGGIRVGDNGLAGAGNPTGSNFNPNLVIDHNRIAQNGSISAGGGGIAIYAGTDNYAITNNLICGNFSAQYGGGIGHFGLSNNGQIVGNQIVSNESFDEGGGVHFSGEGPFAPALLTPGAGSVVVRANLIQGNKGGDDGGGIRTLQFNGLDVANNKTDPTKWYKLDVLDNLVVDNSSADTGGGMAFDDTVKLTVIGNTVAFNDSTATSSDSFGGVCVENTPAGQVCPPNEQAGGLTTSIPSVGGISSIAHGTALNNAVHANGGYCVNPAHSAERICSTWSNPQLVDDILWNNRSFYWDASANSNLGGLLPSPGRTYWDLAVYQTASPVTMSPTYSMLTDGVGATASATNLVGLDPQFVSTYFNVYQASSKGAALGNFVVATFTPNGLVGNYHIQASSPAIGKGSAIPPASTTDVDGQPRTAPVDIGADQH